MTREEFSKLAAGDIIRHISKPEGHLVQTNYGKIGVLIIQARLATEPSEWKLISKAKRSI